MRGVIRGAIGSHMRWSIRWKMGAVQSAALTLAALASGGCYAPPISSERLAESVVITSFDNKADFQSFQSFFIRPEIRVLDELRMDSDGMLEIVPAAAAAPLVAATRANLLERGYTEAATMDQTDLAIELVYLRSVVSDYYCYYWGDWAYWGYPGYSYYYPYCSGASWTSGMLVTNAVDLPPLPETPPPEPPPAEGLGPDRPLLRGLWSAGIYGVEVESLEYSAERTIAGINESFAQSPYFEAAGH